MDAAVATEDAGEAATEKLLTVIAASRNQGKHAHQLIRNPAQPPPQATAPGARVGIEQ